MQPPCMRCLVVSWQFWPGHAADVCQPPFVARPLPQGVWCRTFLRVMVFGLVTPGCRQQGQRGAGSKLRERQMPRLPNGFEHIAGHKFPRSEARRPSTAWQSSCSRVSKGAMRQGCLKTASTGEVTCMAPMNERQFHVSPVTSKTGMVASVSVVRSHLGIVAAKRPGLRRSSACWRT